MSRLFGPVRQLGFVVPDLDAALNYWTQTLGVGPFFVLRRFAPEHFRYRGVPSPSPLLSVALGNSGEMQIELLQQHDQHPSAYRDFLAQGREGLQHLCAWLDPQEYDATLARLQAENVPVLQEGEVPGSGLRFAYFDTDAPGGFLYEISDVIRPGSYELHQRIAQAAASWDGSDPVRELSQLRNG